MQPQKTPHDSTSIGVDPDEFNAGVRQGLTELDNGDSVAIEEVENELPSGIIR
ncbi:MAG TPA: hypothetical protein VJM12_01385 [Pyrinomonadaceae bacterium]|nr:hypothetical protein [Pyrinomonadaceae bacterium]